MATGYTTTDSLQDSLPSVIAAARIVREYEGVMPHLVEKHPLGEGVGNTWNEVSLAQLTAQAISETTELDNAQQLSDTLFSITPTVIGIHTVITDRVAARISKNALAKTGALAQNAIQRKKDKDGLTALDGATTSLCGAGVTLTSGYIGAAVRRITSNTTEPGYPPIRFVGHGYQIKDLEDELTASVGTYPIGDGLTARVFSDGFRGKIAGAEVFEDGLITIDSSDDAIGGVFSQAALVLVQGRLPRAEVKRRPELGGGATSMYYYDEYAYGERSSGNWLYEIKSDATAPTS
jgi:hypothetical protein